MKRTQYIVATTELLLIFPAVLFMTALFVRNLEPQQYEPAPTAQAIVDWYAARPHTGLWVLLVALPFAVLATGCASIWTKWRHDIELRQALRNTLAVLAPHVASLLVFTATVTAGGILAIVALHVLTD